jgi:predicted nucleic acid-binding protein
VSRVFVDTSVLVRYFADDDPARSFAAAGLIDGGDTVVVSTTALLELVHVLRSDHGIGNPALAEVLIRFLSRANVELADADQAATITGLQWTTRVSARRIPDALIAAAAEHAGCDWIATFDERMASPTVAVRTI